MAEARLGIRNVGTILYVGLVDALEVLDRDIHGYA
jgi:hypothetical protein